MSSTIKTAIIGYGKSAKHFHVPLLKAMDDFEIRSVLQRSKSDSQKDLPDAKLMRDMKDLLKDDRLDLVIITTPNNVHFDQAFQALSADKHVVVEKPFTVTSDSAEKLIRLAESKKRTLTVYHNRRWDNDFLTMKKVLNSKVLGEIVEVESSFNRFRNFLRDDAWKEKDLPGSGILYDISPHLIDQALLLFGNPEKIYADIRAQRDGDADDWFEINLFYPGLKVKLKAGMLVPEPSPRFIIRGKKGTFVKFGLDPQENALAAGKNPKSEEWRREPEQNWGTIYKELNGEIVEEKVETVSGNYLNFYEKLKYAIDQKKEPPVDPRTARKGIRIIEKAIESSRQGKVLDLQFSD